MTEPQKSDWNPETYARFRGLRLRPALDLLAQIADLPAGNIIDLGCGDGAASGALKQRFPDNPLIGLDNSPAMLARATGYDQLIDADAALWQPQSPPALIFSNAALHWLPDHATLMPRLAAMLAPAGILAVQMPRQFTAPSHRFLRDIAAALYPDRFDATQDTPVKPAAAYWELLHPFGSVEAWETDYVQHLDPSPERHPVHAFTQATALRPFLEKLNESEALAYTTAYDKALTAAYPLLPDGSALMPFKRVFFVLKV